jgi:hypothetical protein
MNPPAVFEVAEMVVEGTKRRFAPSGLTLPKSARAAPRWRAGPPVDDAVVCRESLTSGAANPSRPRVKSGS